MGAGPPSTTCSVGLDKVVDGRPAPAMTTFNGAADSEAITCLVKDPAHSGEITPATIPTRHSRPPPGARSHSDEPTLHTPSTGSGETASAAERSVPPTGRRAARSPSAGRSPG